MGALDELELHKLSQIVADYRNLGFVAGIVDLVLAVAQHRVKAGAFVEAPAVNFNDEYYKLIVDTITIFDGVILHGDSVNGNRADAMQFRQTILQRCKDSNDYDFHIYLYDWFIGADRCDELLEV
jgi:hypothetical protein